MRMSEINIETVTVHGGNCIGCKRHDKDIMVSVTTEEHGHGDIYDLFFTKDKAERLYMALGKQLENENE
jgi:hypothetical protein